MYKQSGKVSDIISDEIEKRYEEMEELIPSGATLEGFDFFAYLEGGEFKKALSYSPNPYIGKIIKEIQESVDSRLFSPSDADAVDELVLYITNESKLYRLAQDIMKNQAKKIMQGMWSRDLAIKGFSPLVKAGIKLYRKEVPNSRYVPSRVSKLIKDKTAEHLLDYYWEEMEEEVEEMGGVYEIQNLEVLVNGTKKRAPKFVYYKDFTSLPLFKRIKKSYPQIMIDYVHDRGNTVVYIKKAENGEYSEDGDYVKISFRHPMFLIKDIKRDLEIYLQPIS